MIPYKTSFEIVRSGKQPVYIQLTNQFIELIRQGKLVTDSRLPGSRTLSDLLGVHRKTIVACYDELQLQGWIVTIPQKGTYVNADLPILKQRDLKHTDKDFKNDVSGFVFDKNKNLGRSFSQEYDENFMCVNDGISDVRLVPIKEIALISRNLVAKKSIIKHLSYGTTY